MLTRLISVPAAPCPAGANQVRQQLNTREHFWRANAAFTQIVALQQAEPRREGCSDLLAAAAGGPVGGGAGADRGTGGACGEAGAAEQNALPPSKGQKSDQPTDGPKPPRKSHPGFGRALEPTPDRIVDARLDACPHCAAAWADAAQTLQQVYDRIEMPVLGLDPRIRPDVTRVRLFGARRFRTGLAVRQIDRGAGGLSALRAGDRPGTPGLPVRRGLRPVDQRRRAVQHPRPRPGRRWPTARPQSPPRSKRLPVAKGPYLASPVIPAKAGIQADRTGFHVGLDPGFRRGHAIRSEILNFISDERRQQIRVGKELRGF